MARSPGVRPAAQPETSPGRKYRAAHASHDASRPSVRDPVAALACADDATTDAVAQQTTRVSVDASGNEGDLSSGSFVPAPMSADWNLVAFESDATNLVPGDTNSKRDVFVHDRSTGRNERVSVDSLGTEGDGDSFSPSLSDDGRFVAFWSDATNLVSGDTNQCADVFVRDRSAGTTERVSVDSSGAQADSYSSYPVISPDGRFVAFGSVATNLVAHDTNGYGDVFVHDRSTGTTERVSVDSSGRQVNGWSAFDEQPAISADGNLVAFSSDAANLVANDKNGCTDVFVHDRSTGLTERVSVSASGGEAGSSSYGPTLSADGNFVAFCSFANDLVPHDYNFSDVFVHDRTTGGVERVSVNSIGTGGNGDSFPAMISADGNYVAFASAASNFGGDWNNVNDVFVHDRTTNLMHLASVDSSGAQADNFSFGPWISGGSGGEFTVTLMSWATNLVANDSNVANDVFVHDHCETPASWSNYGDGFPGTYGIPAFTSRQHPNFGSTVTLDLANSYGQPTGGLLLLGFQRTDLPTNRGGDLLVLLATTIPTTFSYGGNSYSGTIPDDYRLCGMPFDLQALEFDPGAAMGISFTKGLELVIGN